MYFNRDSISLLKAKELIIIEEKTIPMKIDELTPIKATFKTH